MRRSMVLASSVAVVAACAVVQPSGEQLTYLDQGWTSDLREQFYFTPQGSHMMPAEWFAALERSDDQGRFGDPAYLERFGFIAPQGPSSLNPGNYPIGFAVDANTNQIGLTCAACHTANVAVNGETIRIDGAPAHLDFDRFYQALARAVRLTLLDQSRFERFSTALGITDETAVLALREKLAAFNLRLTGDATLRRPVLASGFGRVDALTQIINSLAVRDQREPANMHPVAAPTSYPALWLTPELEFVQWNPIAASPIARNGGQVLGVFGAVNLTDGASEKAFQSTILLSELHEIEQWLQLLTPPSWDEERMGSIDEELAAQGETLFREHCASCHNMAPYRRTDPSDNFFGMTFIEIGRVDFRSVGTDSAYSTNFLTREVATNRTTASVFGEEQMVAAPRFFTGTVGATIRRAISDAELTREEVFALNGYRFRTGRDGRPVPYEAPSLSDLKAGPLAGVWATGPYLHNGSVPTVYELLSPVDERRTVFWTGGRALDLRNLGYESGDAPKRFRFDTELQGNGNGGHVYPARGFGHEERMAVIEYLKSQ